MTDLAATLEAGPGLPPLGRACHYQRIIDGLDIPTAVILDRSLRGTEWTDAGLARVLTESGHPISAGQLSRHRTGVCICPSPVVAGLVAGE